MMTDLLEKCNILLMSKELNEKDRNLKSILITTKDDNKTPSESIFVETGFFRDVKSDSNIHKIDFPKEALIYINQTYLTIKKSP